MDIFSYLMGKKSGGSSPTPPTPFIPDDYTQVMWVVSSGTQYIDTGYKIKSNTKIEIFGRINMGLGAGAMCGCRNSANVNNYFIATKSIKEGDVITASYFQINYGDTDYLATNDKCDDFSYISISSNEIKVNTTTYSDITISNSPDYNFYLFCLNSGGTAVAFSTSRIGRFRVSEGDNVVVELIPCYRNSDNEVGFYDRVSNTFLTNQGTGTFTYQELI